MTDKPWIYSHTQLALWKLCKRRYYYTYVAPGHKREPKTPAMAAGTWLCQAPVEDYEAGLIGTSDHDIWWPDIWANFLAEFGGDEHFDSPIYTKDVPAQVLTNYRASPVPGKVVEIEKRYEIDLNGFMYSSKPDFVAVDHQGERTTWDIKLKTFYQKKAGETWNIKPTLSLFDDQCVGQAVLAGAQYFGQIQFWLGKADGKIYGPFYVEHPLSPVLAKEWRLETLSECIEIDGWRRVPYGPWPKYQQSCNAFGHECRFLEHCKFGF